MSGIKTMVSLGTALVLSLLHTSAIPNVHAADTSPTLSAGAPPDAANIAQIIDDLKAAAVEKVVVVAAQGVLSDADRESLRDAGAAAGLVVLLKEVEVGSAEALAAELEKVRSSGAEAVLPMGDTSVVQAVMKQMRRLALEQPVLVYEPGSDGQRHLVKKSVMPIFETVLGFKRPDNTELVFLKNGDKFTGTVLNETISIRTSYASAIEFDTRLLAGLLFEGQAHMETVFTVNGNRLSGFIDDPAIVFKLAEGPQISIRKEKITKILFRIRTNELVGIPRNYRIVLNNGDILTGFVQNRTLRVKTTQTDISVETASVERMAMIGEENVLTILTLKGAGGQIQGILLDEDVEIDLDCGPVVKVYPDNIKEVVFQRGFALNGSLQRQLAKIRVRSGRWKYIVIHHSDTEEGTIKAFDSYHRRRGMSNGLAYHFVIGNGKGMGDGEVAIGNRWLRQLEGGHVRRRSLNQVGIGICLVGDFQKRSPTTKQMRSLRALVDYLLRQYRIKGKNVTTHRKISHGVSLCPGRHFPEESYLKEMRRYYP